MAQIVLKPLAAADLRSIWNYIADESSEETATRFLKVLENTLGTLADFPRAGHVYGDVYPNLRALPVGAYVIFYEPLEEGISVFRVLHGKRDLESELGS